MVRETRFAFDDDIRSTNPQQNEDFTEEDDRFLDVFCQPRKQSPVRQDRGQKSNPRGKSRTTKKHLSDADWLTPKPPAQSRRRKPA